MVMVNLFTTTMVAPKILSFLHLHQVVPKPQPTTITATSDQLGLHPEVAAEVVRHPDVPPPLVPNPNLDLDQDLDQDLDLDLGPNLQFEVVIR